MAYFFPMVLTAFFLLFLYILITPTIRFLHRERKERIFTEQMLDQAKKLYGFSDGDFVIMVENSSQTVFIPQGEKNE